MLCTRDHLKIRDTYRLKVKGWKKTFHTNGDQNKAGVAILMEKAMAPQSSTLAWKIPWTEEPARL